LGFIQYAPESKSLCKWIAERFFIGEDNSMIYPARQFVETI